MAGLDKHLRDHTVMVGERFTIADSAPSAYTHVAPEGGFDLAPYPAVVSWLARVRLQPGHVSMGD